MFPDREQTCTVCIGSTVLTTGLPGECPPPCPLPCGCLVTSDSCHSMDHSLPGSSVHGVFQARILGCGGGCHFLLQGNFLTQGLSMILLCLLHWQVGSLPRRHQESPKYSRSLFDFSSPFFLFCIMSSLPPEASVSPPSVPPSCPLLPSLSAKALSCLIPSTPNSSFSLLVARVTPFLIFTSLGSSFHLSFFSLDKIGMV